MEGKKNMLKESSILVEGGWKTTLIYGLVISITAFIAFIIPPLFEVIKDGFDINFIYQDIVRALGEGKILDRARTYCFTALSFAELIHMIGMSDINCSIIKILRKKNIFMYVVLFVGILMQILLCQIPLFANFFHVLPLGIIEWIFLFLISLIPIIFHEILKK